MNNSIREITSHDEIEKTRPDETKYNCVGQNNMDRGQPPETMEEGACNFSFR